MWLLQTAMYQALKTAQAGGAMPTAAQQLDYAARMSAVHEGDTPRLLTIAGDNAEIAVNGVLTNRPSVFAFLFGGGNATYSDIITALAVADQDPAVKRIDLNIDSPGGSVAGLFDALAAIEATTTPVRAVVSNMAASAAFAIATQADEIVAGNRATVFGSVGIVVSAFVDEDEVTITSTDAPNKRPDLSTEAGRAVVRAELDEMHGVFADAIATGRGTTIDKVNADFGQGGTFLAAEALQRGMIDSIAPTALNLVQTDGDTAATIENQPEATNMDLNKLLAEHPAVYAQVLALGNTAGVAQERERASAHLIMGEGMGAMATAIKAVKDGDEMTASLQATYMTAGVNRRDVTDATTDDATVAAVVDGSASATDDADGKADEKAGVDILNLAAEFCGTELEV